MTMCMSKAPKPKPVPAAPTALPTSVDAEAQTAAREEQLAQRRRRGSSRTVLTGLLGGGMPATQPIKSLLGS